MTFKADLGDFHFNLNELGLLKQVQDLPGYEEITDDVVSAVLEENARFVEGKVAPLNVIGDREHSVWDNGNVKTPIGFKAAFDAHAQSGWQALQHDPQYGGQGFPKLIAAITSENMNAANLSFALCPLLTDGCIEAIMHAGTEGQKQKFVPPMLEGRWTGTMNLTEPQAGSDLALVNTKAVKQAGGSYRITGQKIFITYGEHDLAENIVHLVLARTPDAPAGVKGISLFVVPKFLVNEDGSLGARNDVWCASVEHKLGINASPTAVLLFGDNKGDVGEGAVGYLVGEENAGLSYMFVMMNEARFNVGVQGTAVSERAYQHALAYAKERIQSNAIEGSSGSVAIIHHPDVQRMLQTMRGLTQASRSIALFAATSHDIAARHADAATCAQHKAMQEYLVPIVKAFSTEMSLEVTSLGVQVHGGMGFIEETGAAQYYRDARILPIYEGTTAIQANDFIGRKTLRDGGAVAKGFIQAMRATLAELEQFSSQEKFALLAKQFKLAIDAYETALNTTLRLGSEGKLRAAFSASVPFLMLAGYIHGAWHLARSALVCHDKAGELYEQKFDTAIFYAAHILPRAAALATAVEAAEIVGPLMIKAD